MKSINHINQHSSTLNNRGQLLDLKTPIVMGILNVTPDSFFDGGSFTNETDILEQVEKMLLEGASIIDVGGYSSRPNAENISEEIEIGRSINAIKLIVKKFPTALLSIDTFRAEVARQAVLEGASIVNDISAGELDPKMFETVAALHVPYIIMHMRGTPQTMKNQANYENLIKEVVNFFHQKVSALQSLGVSDILIDPGFGFAKTAEQNFDLLQHLHYLKFLDKPIVVGVSRKSMIWKSLGTNPELALNGTTALHMAALLQRASILRVHDVKEAVEVVKLYSSIN